VADEDLKKQIKEMSLRISELERMLAQALAPINEMRSSTQRYLKLVNLALKHGSLSPEMLVPEVKDPISKDIINVLVDKSGQNISQITDAVRARRGSASRRIVREKLRNLEEKGFVEQRGEGSIPEYYITDEVLTKWSQLLGISK
jgi:DNA-binding transcriptional ArsR family regulator